MIFIRIKGNKDKAVFSQRHWNEKQIELIKWERVIKKFWHWFPYAYKDITGNEKNINKISVKVRNNKKTKVSWIKMYWISSKKRKIFLIFFWKRYFNPPLFISYELVHSKHEQNIINNPPNNFHICPSIFTLPQIQLMYHKAYLETFDDI